MFRRIWCEMRSWHPTALWTSEWTYAQGKRTRTLECRCSACGWVRYRRVEEVRLAPTPEAGS